MPNLPFYMAGEAGIVKDIAPHELPAMTWSNGENIVFRDGKVTRRDGQIQKYAGHLGQPHYVQLAYTPTNVFWIYADQTKLFATNGGQHAEITRLSGVYATIDLNRLWDGGMFQGIPVMTNGKDKPQAWTTVSLTNRMVDIPAWPATHIARVLRPFKNFLVAMYISRGGNTFPNMILWSDAADPGSMPTTWDVADPNNLAGERDLVDEYPGGIRGALPLRDILVIYKDNAVWGMQFIGGTQIMRTYMILGGIGMLGAHCVTAIDKGQKHVFATADDLIVFDGQSSASVLDKKWKKYLAANIDGTTGERSFVFAREKTTEVWFCYPEIGQQFPNVAVIWNWVDGTVSHRDLGHMLSSAAVGPVVDSGDPWDLDLGTWDSDATIWDAANFRPANFDVLASRPSSAFGTSMMLQLETDQTYEGVQYSAFVERLDSAFGGQNSDGTLKADFEMRKLAKRIWPHIEGAPVQIQVGAREMIDDSVPIDWAPAQTFTPGVDKYLDFIVNGRFISVRVQSDVAGVWKFEGYNMEIEPLGNL